MVLCRAGRLGLEAGAPRRFNGVFDEILAVLPFEPATMARLGGPPTCYVGHPATSRLGPQPVVHETGPLLLLPGSREELRRHCR